MDTNSNICQHTQHAYLHKSLPMQHTDYKFWEHTVLWVLHWHLKARIFCQKQKVRNVLPSFQIHFLSLSLSKVIANLKYKISIKVGRSLDRYVTEVQTIKKELFQDAAKPNVFSYAQL